MDILLQVCLLWLADLTMSIDEIAHLTSGVELLGIGIGHYTSAELYKQFLSLGSFQVLPQP